MLYNGERIGDGTPPETDIAVDPVEGTTLTSLGRGNAISVIAVCERGTMFNPGPCVYMEKIAVGPEAAGVVDIRKSPTENLHAVAEAKKEHVHDVTAVILDREPPRRPDRRGPRGRRPHPPHPGRRRHRRRLHRLARLRRRHPVRHRRHPRGRDRRRGHEVHGRRHPGPALAPQRRGATAAAIAAGYDLEQVLTTDDLVQGDNCFFAVTGITDGEVLKGVHYDSGGATTQSLVMRSKSGTVRLINARHRLEKLKEFSSIEFG